MPLLNKIEPQSLIGERHNRVTFISEPFYKNGNKRHRYVKYVCECGNISEGELYHIRQGHIKSCGCLNSELRFKRRYKHGLSKHRLMVIWGNMYDRCLNERNSDYPGYGGRGIEICNEWANNFKAFYDWAVINGYSSKLQIDRINNDGNYDPNNCRWVTPKQNARNRRTSLMIAYKGEIKNLSEWCEILGLNYKRTHLRIKRDCRTLEYCVNLNYNEK